MPELLCTLPLPEPFPSRMEGAATVRVIGHQPGGEALAGELRDRPADVLCPQLADAVDARVLDAGLPRLRAVCVYAVGYNNVDVAAATERGVVVANTPGVLTDATADVAIGLVIAAARRIVEGDMAMRAGSFEGWAPEYMLGLELRGALLGVVGFGRIGQAVARRARALGMRLAVLDRAGLRLPDDLRAAVTVMDFETLLTESDVLSLHCPLSDATHHLIDESALRRMKPTAVLVNTARGPLVDEAVLVRALTEGWIAAAGLDVYELEPAMSPGLRACPNAVLSPHLGSATVATRAAMAGLVADNALAALQGRMPPQSVNPQAWR